MSDKGSYYDQRSLNDSSSSESNESDYGNDVDCSPEPGEEVNCCGRELGEEVLLAEVCYARLNSDLGNATFCTNWFLLL